jgi:hypothetical protein
METLPSGFMLTRRPSVRETFIGNGLKIMLRMITRKLCEWDLVGILVSLEYSETDRKLALLERHAVLQSPSRIEELVKIFVHATRVCSIVRKLEVLMLTY